MVHDGYPCLRRRRQSDYNVFGVAEGQQQVIGISLPALYGGIEPAYILLIARIAENALYIHHKAYLVKNAHYLLEFEILVIALLAAGVREYLFTVSAELLPRGILL